MRLSVHQVGETLLTDKPDVVFIHGTGADASLWQPQVDMIAPLGHRCFLPELRGHGATHEPLEPTDLQVHVQDLLETLESVPIRLPAIFVGHSLGAMICVGLAAQRPEMVHHILAISMPGRVLAPVAAAFQLFLHGPYHWLKGTPVHQALPNRQRILVRTNHHSLKEIVTNFKRVNYIRDGVPVDCRVHFSVGRLDFVAPARFVEQMHQQLPNSTLRIFDWAGHTCMDDQQEEFNQWFMEKFMDGLPVGSKLEQMAKPTEEAF